MTYLSDAASMRLLKIVRNLKLLASGLFLAGLSFGGLFISQQSDIENRFPNLVTCIAFLMAAIFAQKIKNEVARVLMALTTTS